MTEIIKVSAVGPFGVNSKGVWYKLGKGVQTSSFVKGHTYSLEIGQGSKGAKFINQIVQDMGNVGGTEAPKPLLNPDLNTTPPAPSASPKVDNRPVNEYGKPVSDYAIAKDKRISRSGVIQAAVQAMTTHVQGREELEKEATLLAEAMLKWINEVN